MSMTRQEQLDAVVRNYGEWAGNKNHLLAFWNYGFVDYVLPAELDNGKFRGEFYCFTRAEVEQRKADLQNKPSWDDAPEWAEWLAQDEHFGKWFWYKAKPGTQDEYFVTALYYLFESTGEVIGDWRDTLEKRPVVVDKPAPEEEEAFKMLEARNGECIGGSLTDEGSKWDGEGLPPVGAEFEYSYNGKHWGQGVMLFNDGITCLVANKKHPSDRWHYKCEDGDAMFRPIKSDREEWIEDCEEFISGYATWEAAAAAMYDGFKSGKLKLPEVD